MSAVLIIIIGIVVGGWAAKANTVIESQRPIILQGPLGGIIQFLCQFGGLGLQIYGVFKLLSWESHMEVFGHLIVFFLGGFQQFMWRAQGGRNSSFSGLLLIGIAIGGVVFLGWWALLTMFVGMILGPVLARPQ